MAQQIINNGTFDNDPSAEKIRTAFDKANENFTELYTNKLDKVSTAGVERAYIINADGSQGTKATNEIGYNQIYKTISANTTIDDTYHGALVWITATCNITIPSGLRADFYMNVRTFASATASYLTSGTTINSESDGTIQTPSSMANISTYSTNNFIISGGGLS